MPRPRSLTPDRIASAALTVIDRDGLTGFTMRAVAAELAMSAMALYRYIDDRGELERLVVERVLDGIDVSPPDPKLPWAARVTLLLRRMRAAVAAHPAVAPLVPVHRHRSAAVLRWTETVLGLLTEAGLTGERRVLALRALLGYLLGAIQLEHLGPLAGAGTAALAELAPQAYPHLADTARTARHIDPDAEFDGGLALLLRGLTAPPD
ncbi:TetR/AcrR family transcriptional regulator [Micromonospora endophytica]|uniref:TetR family transcriptional regulator n=1 Tax=Micromonospora endophytica TaxID=515350 RepID=A0A2W2D0W0_9ACTN|nr:TetR/AcrR family transcriptional regulator [Micromonospora endophytica]PZF99284.1 TetR family transcriptional regulator [Micromonospora endophytica]RIW48714.1 TetR family transcriptional regulator [Micromonospora endophytica]BCJ59914.1 tetracycline repressor, C-all-alpha domain protein [Micromonospora endophytica]